MLSWVGLLLETNFKYQNDHGDKFGGAIFGTIRGLFNYFMFTKGHTQCENGPLVLGSMGHFKVLGANPTSGRPRNIPDRLTCQKKLAFGALMITNFLVQIQR